MAKPHDESNDRTGADRVGQSTDGDRAVAVVVSRPDGEVLEQNSAARALLGRRVGASCFSSMTGVDGADRLPCSLTCAAELHEEGKDGVRRRTVALDGAHYELCCVPVNGHVVTTLVAAPERPEPWERFTPREMDVLRLLAEGQTTGEIAATLDISSSTVRAHVEHMRVKLDAPTRAALVARGFLMGYLP